jgi:hypothetical protein
MHELRQFCLSAFKICKDKKFAITLINLQTTSLTTVFHISLKFLGSLGCKLHTEITCNAKDKNEYRKHYFEA